ncbi:MAG: serine/threonine protein kinase [Myxococcales bacterium]|nr:serine/threonine protein kinase [Myxococcales bacterium]
MLPSTPRAPAFGWLSSTPPAHARTLDPRDLAAAELTAAARGAPTLFAHIGRFTVLERLGEGGMGIVWAAYDNELDRKVAVKVLRDDTARRDARARDRLLREAQAMARLSHPNIVAVHEAGWHEGQVFLAMEFVRGHNLAAWLQAGHLDWRNVLNVVLQAGRGLAAAHAAGIIHRDFKPANTLVGVDGVVKVLDFGLARSLHSSEPPTPQEKITPITSQLDADITRTGAVLGTPAYMAPEQHLGHPATEKSDQFSYCVTLYEALYGQHPFDTSSLISLAYSITQGNVREPPASAPVPRPLFQIIARGLSVDPNNRFPSMNALLAALEQTRERRRLTRWLPAAALVGLLAAAGAASLQSAPNVQACNDTAHELVGLWDHDASDAARASVLATGLPYAGDTWERVRPRLDEYARALVDMRGEACRAHAEGRSSLHLFDQRTACLDARHASLAAFVGILASADEDVVRNAAAGAAALPAIATCGAAQVFVDAVPLEPQLAPTVAAARATLAEAHAHELAGQYARGLELVDRVAAQTIAFPPLQAELGLRRGSLLSEAGRHQEADDVLTAALTTSLSAGHAPVSAALITRRAFVRAARLQRAGDVLTEAPIADGLVARLADTPDGPLLRGDHFNNLGIAHAVLGDQQAARELFTRSIDLRREALGADHPQVVYALANLGLSLAEGSDLLAAADHLRRAFTAAETGLGPKHPHVALVAVNLGYVHRKLGRQRDAAVFLGRALTLQQELLGDGPDLQFVLTNLGDLAVDQRRCDVAAAHHRRALALVEAARGPDDPAAVQARLGLGDALACAGDLAAARPIIRRALAQAEALWGEGLRVAHFHDVLGAMYLQAGELPAALAAHTRALAIRKAHKSAEPAELALSHEHLAAVYRRMRRPDQAAAELLHAQVLLEAATAVEGLPLARVHHRLGELALDHGPSASERATARAHLERAINIYAAISDPDAAPLALARFSLARLLADDDDQARILAAQALAALEEKGAPYAGEARDITAFLARKAARAG